MNITIIAVGKIKEKYLRDGIQEYAKRLSRFCGLQMIEAEDEQAAVSLSPAQEEQVKKKEADRILKKLKEGSFVVALDVKGVKLDSEAFAARLQGYFVSGISHITFIIGGSLGLHDSVTGNASLRLSVSDMTFPHQLARLILLEQIYRAFKINNGETYHK
ncbi:MAG: 23S rRNA (pseudouridine(1915)-N(3))-methyltransferase RlmH [Ruminiclostridium sp.]|nr:23S rRNA (pseudouridine(1915)-N(3))-methyltransferase RlmH [Ruminiclostridium sp.]